MFTQLSIIILFACGDADPVSTEKEKLPPKISDSSKVEAPKSSSPKPIKPKVDAINDKNWKQHPDVKEIRTLVSGFLSEDAKLDTMHHTFNDMCGDKHIFKIQLSNTKEGSLAIYQIVETFGDMGRDTKIVYDGKGDARFVMSEYTHSSAESNYLSRAYYKNGKHLYSPPVEQRSQNSGPQDDKEAKDLVILTAKDAGHKFFAIAQDCQPK